MPYDQIPDRTTKLNNFSAELMSVNLDELTLNERKSIVKLEEKVLKLLTRYKFIQKQKEIIDEYAVLKKQKQEAYQKAKVEFKETLKTNQAYLELKKDALNLPVIAKKHFYNLVTELETKYDLKNNLAKDRKGEISSILNDEEKLTLKAWAKDDIPLKKAIHNEVMEVANRVEIVKILQKKPTRLSGVNNNVFQLRVRLLKNLKSY